MSLAMFLVLPMVFLVSRLFAKRVYLTEGLTIEEYKVRKETVNKFLSKIFVIGLGVMLIYITLYIVISVVAFLLPYVIIFFLILFGLEMFFGGAIGAAVAETPAVLFFLL